jgi:hypothetical protein
MWLVKKGKRDDGERGNAMKIVRLLILTKEDVKESLAQLGADVARRANTRRVGEHVF